MENLADASDEVAVVLEKLRQGYDVRKMPAKVSLEIEYFRGIRAKTRQQRDAARTAERKLIVSAIKANAASREPIDVRGLGERVPVTTEGIVQVIHCDEKDIGFALGSF